MEKLLYVLKLNEDELKIMLYNYLAKKNMSPIIDDGFVYAKGNIPILLVAHMDTVFDEPPKRLYYEKGRDKLFSFGGGIGGDDRCGIYAIIKILEKYKPYVLFTEKEEIGGIGALKAVEKLEKPDVKYIIEFDRRGSNDCVFYECGNEEFIEYVESFGFVTDYGTFSDISILGSEWDIAAVNLSSGYYNEHTHKEYIKFNELTNNINRAKLMLRKHKEAKYFDYQEIQYLKPSDTTYYDNYSFEEISLWLEHFNISIGEVKQQDDEKKLILRKEDKVKKKDDDK